jgi:DNA polymerase/3'-5' exonuclease PolX
VNEIANKLRKVADLLAAHEASPYRVAAYRRSAEQVEAEKSGAITDAAVLAAIDEIERTGELTLLDRLRGVPRPERLFASLPGIGPKTARLLHEWLQIRTFEELEKAALDGRLGAIPGMAGKRIEMVSRALHQYLHPPQEDERDGR